MSSGKSVDVCGQPSGSASSHSAAPSSANVALLLNLQSVLWQLQVTSVREAFVAQRVIQTDDDPAQILACLDAFYQIITPDWHCDSKRREQNYATVEYHLENLTAGSDEILEVLGVDDGYERFTYAAWMHALQKLMNSKYWKDPDHERIFQGRVKKVKQNVKFEQGLLNSGSGNVELRRNAKLGKMKFRYAEDSSESPDSEEFRSLKRRSSRRKTRAGFYDVELTDSSSESTCQSDTSESEPCRRSRRSFFPREVVQPQPFSMDGNISLGKFLDKFERYFKSKFDGNQRDCTQELGRFISGELKQAYDALGGAQRKYRDMKAALLQWSKAQGLGKTRRWKTELQQAGMKRDETLKLYCMRLEEVAQRAYPSDRKECVKQLKNVFVKTAPSEFLKHMDERERIKVALRQGKSLTWGEIVELAEWVDKKRKKAQLKDCDDELDKELTRRLCNLKSTTKAALGSVAEIDRPARIFRNSSQMQGASANSSRVECHWCGWLGHEESKCWKKLGCCGICGSDEHTITGCPKYVPRRIARPFQPKCPMCGGSHCGADCPTEITSRTSKAPLNTKALI